MNSNYLFNHLITFENKFQMWMFTKLGSTRPVILHGETFLVKYIENACELFTNVTYMVHGDDIKARISIMFVQNDKTQIVRKSKSKVSRDHKRMDKYNNSKTDNIDQCVDISITVMQKWKSTIIKHSGWYR